MVNPTGYTALDLIGFTDKGTYSSSDNYVKNDLVHYSGNIWRCLIDDTTGITPAEGVNWTLFIGEPTNLVEAAIASIEQTPSTSAYTVGRRLFYNDILYEVIAAIAVGDNLIAYEDDPTNANIKVSAKVEEQIDSINNALTNTAYLTSDTTETTLASDDVLPFYDTSATAKRKMTVANVVGQTVSNPNLLDNPWFTVNQRGFTSTNSTNVFTFMDRWRLAWNPDGATVSLANDILTIDNSANANNSCFINQRFEFDNIVGKECTASIMLSDGTIYKGTNTFVAEGQNLKRFIPSTSTGNKFGVYCEYPNDGHPQLVIQIEPLQRISIKAVKLELGSVSTLAMDPAPNYQQELAKCQRYFVRLKNISNQFGVIGFGEVHTTTGIWALLPLPTPMRTVPSLTFVASKSNAIVFQALADTGATSVSINSFNAIMFSTNLLKVNFVTDAQTQYSIGTYGNIWINDIDNTSYIDVSADL